MPYQLRGPGGSHGVAIGVLSREDTGNKSAGKQIWGQVPHGSPVTSGDQTAMGAGGKGGEAGACTTFLRRDRQYRSDPELRSQLKGLRVTAFHRVVDSLRKCCVTSPFNDTHDDLGKK